MCILFKYIGRSPQNSSGYTSIAICLDSLADLEIIFFLDNNVAN